MLPADRRAELAIRAVDRLCASVGWTRPTVLITGFWRSGTTWLQQSLTATLHGKSVFEPLAPSIPAYGRWLARYELPSEAARHAFMPCLDAMNDHEIWRYLDRSFAGCSQGRVALLSRQDLAETWRRRVVVKCVRASFAHSPVTERQAGAPAEGSRADAWRNQLSGEDIARIVAIIAAVFPSYTA